MSDKTVGQRFVDAWGEIENPALDRVNPHFKNKYATLKSTLGVIRKACKPHGIAYVQKLVSSDGVREFRSFLLSEDGEEMALSSFPVERPSNPQAFGSNLTYAKRQQAQADWGITGEEDDDGNAAADDCKGRVRPDAGKKKPPAPPEQDAVKAAWNRLLTACAAYEGKRGMEPKAAVEGVKARTDYPDRAAPDADKAAWFNAVAEELEAEL